MTKGRIKHIKVRWLSFILIDSACFCAPATQLHRACLLCSDCKALGAKLVILSYTNKKIKEEKMCTDCEDCVFNHIFIWKRSAHRFGKTLFWTKHLCVYVCECVCVRCVYFSENIVFWCWINSNGCSPKQGGLCWMDVVSTPFKFDHKTAWRLTLTWINASVWQVNTTQCVQAAL